MTASGVWLNSNLFRAALRARRKDTMNWRLQHIHGVAEQIAKENAARPFWRRGEPATREEVLKAYAHCNNNLSLESHMQLARAHRTAEDALAAIDRLDRAAMLADEIFVSSDDIKLVGI